MNGNAELLNFVYQNAEMGVNTMKQIMQTIADSSSSHIAKMLITGSNMGIVEAAQNLKKYAHADKDAVKLMERLMKTEEKNVQELKQYL